MKKTLKLLCGIICLLSVVLITLSGCDMGNLFDGSVNVPKGDGFTPVYYGMLMSTSPDVEIPPVSYEDVVKENAGNNGNHNGWYKKPDKDKENNGNTDNNGNHYGWYKDDNGDGKLDEDFQQQLCYLSQNQDVYFYVGIGNPAQLEIVSIQINGKTYTSDMFEANSTNEVKILKHNVGNAGGIVEYTIEEIKYSDGTEVKDVVLAGNKTARAGIKVENAVTATVNNIELRDSGKEIFFDITIADDYSLIANSNGVITVTVYRDGKSVKSTELIVGKNEVTIETLNKNKEHEYEIVAYYDDLLGEGATYHTLISRRPVQEIHTHTFDVWTVTKEASCTEDGEKMRTCTACGEIETEKISATGKHAFGEWKVTKCGALGESGEKTRTCSVCGETETQVFIDVVEIEWVTTKAVSCTEDGERTRTCPICGETETEIIPAPGKHSVGAWVITKDVSCTENGEETRTCAACGEEETRAILATGHKWSHACDTTCNVVGCDYTRVTEHTYDNACDADCNICGEIRVVLGHVYDNACDADCNECGFTRVTDHTYDDQYDAVCNVCGFVRDAECAHKNVITLPGKEANCIETGLTEGQKCGDCGETIVEQTIIPATGIHNYESTVTPPTATTNGVITYTCSCTNSYTEELVPSDFTITADNRAMVGYTGAANENLVIPAVFEDNGTWYRVVGIDEWAFYGSIGLANVTIPETMRTIGAFSFVECDGLISVTMLGATTIGYNAFNSCDQLSTVTFPNSLTTIEGFAFFACVSLENITIPNSVTVIGECAFRACYKLTSMHIPASVTTIGYGVFGECTGLIAITVDADNPVYYSEGNCIIERDSKALIQGCKTSVIPQDTTSISREAFYWISLTNVTIPNTVTTIGEAVFSWTGLDSITFTGTIAQWMNIEKGSRWDDGTGNYTVYCTDGTIAKDGTITYYEVASKGLEFTLNPDGASYSVTGIGTCTDTDIIIPSEYEGLPVTAIGDYAFFLCANLTSITIGDSITTIGDFAIGCCANLTSVTIGGSVTTISTYTFYDCANLTSIVVDVGNTAYQSINENLYTKDGTILIAYAIGKTDTSFAIPNSVTTIGDYAFYDCTNLTSVTIPGSVTTIGDYAFHFCTNLTSVMIPVSVITIGDYAFAACTNLTSATIGDSVTFIGGHAFSNCYNLTNITIPNSVTTIKIGTFASCTNLTSVTISTSVTAIDESAFAWSSNLTDVYYTGSGSEWEQITIGYDNDYLINATRYYYSETQPTTEGNFWHYVDGVPTVWEAHKHTEAILSAVAPTCTETGLTEGKYCTTCGKIIVEQNIVPVVDHTEVIDPAVEPTCIQTGLTAGKHCAACGKIIVEQNIVPVVDHTYDDKYDAICNVCGFVREAECAHKNVITLPRKEATCSKTGLTEGKKCGDCGETIIEQEIIPATGVHTYESKGTPSDDYATVFVTYTCSSCGDMYSETIAPSNFTLSWETRYMLGYNGEGDGTFIIPACFQHNGVWYRVTEIGYEAFTWEDQFVNIIIPDSVTRIGFYAFNNCGSLTDITIGKGVTYIEWGAFPYCGALKNFTVVEGNIEYYVEGNCLIERSFEAVVKGSANSVIPQGIKMIVHFAFASCENLTQITIPNSVTTIHYNAFDYCYDLTSITFEGTIAEWNVIDKESGWDNTIGNYIVYCTDGKTCKNHSYEREITTEPTATTNGVVTYTCPNCGDAYSESIVPIDFVVTSDNREMVGYTGEMYENLVIPAFFENGGTWYRVTQIGDWAFGGCNLLSVVIPEGVTVIGEGAFDYNFFLENVQIPESVTTIESYGFAHCFKLISIALSDNVTSIAYDAFLGCGIQLTSITVGENNPSYYVDGNCLIERSTKALLKGCNDSVIPQYVTRICDGAFYFCKELTTVTIPNTVISIGSQAFQECDKLTSIIIPDSVTSIGLQAFCDCNAITHVYYVGTEEEWATVTVASNNDSLVNATRYYYSETQPTTEGNYWHYVDGVPTVWEIHIHNYTSVVTTEPTATANGVVTYTCSCGDFYTEEIVPQDFSVTKDNRAMVGYTGAENENLVIPAVFKDNDVWYRVTSIGMSAFYTCSNLTGVTIPDTVTTIDNWAFHSCTNLTSVTIPDSVTSIGADAFRECYSLASVTIPDSVITIGGYAFYDCDGLTSITIPDSVTTIGDSVFIWCDNLTSVTIGNSVTSIGDSTFYECTNLTSVIIGDSVTTIGGGAFAYCYNLTSITLPDAVTTIGNSVFYDCDNLTSVTIGDSVTTIGDHAFYRCSNLTNIKIPDAVTTIGSYAFYECSNLTNITIPNSVTTISNDVFYGCSSLTSITIPDSVTTINGYAFHSCTNLTNVTIGNSVTTIGYGAFCSTNLTSITLPDSVTTIGNAVFYGCSNLTSITIPDSVTTIGAEAFIFCYNLTSVTIPDSVTTIGAYAFADCSSLTSITIPDSVTTIGDGAFGSTNLTSITLPDSVTTIGNEVFYGCSNLTSVTIPDSVTTIGNEAFSICWKLKSITFEGTVEQWNAIEKGDFWNNGIPATEVVCSDGVVSLN